MSDAKKVLLRLDDEAQETLDRLVSTTDATTHAEAIRDAVGVYASILDLLNAKPKGDLVLAIRDRREASIQDIMITTVGTDSGDTKEVMPVFFMGEKGSGN